MSDHSIMPDIFTGYYSSYKDGNKDNLLQNLSNFLLFL